MPFRRRMCVAKEGVCWRQRCGDGVRAPRHVIPGRGLHQIHGKWGTSATAKRTPVGTAILVPRRPRDRMGLGGAARKHARYQRERNVYRSARSAVGGRGFHGAIKPESPCETRLLCEAHRARARHGRLRGGLRVRKPEIVPGATFLAVRHGSIIPFYTKGNDALS